MLDLDLDIASSFVASTITLYPAIDPLPSFLIIKSFRNATIGRGFLKILGNQKTIFSDVFQQVFCCRPGNKYRVRPAITISGPGREFTLNAN